MAALLGSVLAGPTEESLLTLDKALLRTQIAGQDLPERQLTLPLHWDVVHPGQSGQAHVQLAFNVAETAVSGREPYGLFVSRLGTAYEVELNGVLLARAGSMADEHDRFTSKHPVHITIPAQLLRSQNELTFHLRADAGYRAGLSNVVLGPEQLVLPLARKALWWRVTLPQAASVFSLLVAAFCALLWWQQRDPLYAWAGFGEALWAASVADAVTEFAPMPWPYWGLSLLLMRAAWAWSLYAIAQEVFGRRPRLEFWVMLAIQAAAPACVLLIVLLHSMVPLLAWYTLNFMAWGWVIVQLLIGWLRQGGAERFIVLGAVVAVVAASLRDVVAARLEQSLYDESAFAKYLATLVGAALMWIVSRRFLKARSDALRLSGSLAAQVAHKEQELRDSFAQFAAAERSRAAMAERERILRDMHDGVGAHLATAVRQLESGAAQTQDVVQTLRDSMDHLKLTIDAMNLPAGDVNALLASLRYRLQPRLESAGLQWVWTVDSLPHWAGGDDARMRHLQFLLLEAISNVLQHAQATSLEIVASADEAQICIVMKDNGKGLTRTDERTLSALRRRATAVGATVTVHNGSPGTSVQILLPIAASGAET